MGIEQLKSTAEYYCDLYRLGKISREKAKENIIPYKEKSEVISIWTEKQQKNILCRI